MTRLEIAISLAAGAISLLAVIESLIGLPAAAEPWLWRLPLAVALGIAVCALLASRSR